MHLILVCQYIFKKRKRGSSFEKEFELDASLVTYLSIVLDISAVSRVICCRSHLRGKNFEGELAPLNKILIVGELNSYAVDFKIS